MAKKETGSDRIKHDLVRVYGGEAKEWKRRSKKKVGGVEVREFEHDDKGSVWVYGDGIEQGAEEAKKYLFAITPDPYYPDNGLVAVVAPKCIWDDEQRVGTDEMSSDKVVADMLKAQGLGYSSEGVFEAGKDVTAGALAKLMKEQGFGWNEAFQAEASSLFDEVELTEAQLDEIKHVIGDGVSEAAAPSTQKSAPKSVNSKTAKYLFAVSNYPIFEGSSSSVLTVHVTPKKIWEKEGRDGADEMAEDEGFLRLLPKGSAELMEGAYQIPHHSSVKELAETMLKLGFSWDASYQETVAGQWLPEAQDVYDAHQRGTPSTAVDAADASLVDVKQKGQGKA